LSTAKPGAGALRIDVLADAAAVAHAAAECIAAAARAAAAARGRFVLAVSGGRTPWVMLRALASLDVPWPAVQIVQVDERVAPVGDPDRNLTRITESLLALVPLHADQVHAMPVEAADLAAAARQYAQALRRIGGTPPILDLAHLGLGPDGHTASLVPEDPVLAVTADDVALTGPYQGRRRMTLTYPVLARARQLLWVVTGADKAAMVHRLVAGDRSIPAGCVRAAAARLLVDRAAAGALALRS
jgi:6-phosphogluconolactonase